MSPTSGMRPWMPPPRMTSCGTGKMRSFGDRSPSRSIHCFVRFAAGCRPASGTTIRRPLGVCMLVFAPPWNLWNLTLWTLTDKERRNHHGKKENNGEYVFQWCPGSCWRQVRWSEADHWRHRPGERNHLGRGQWFTHRRPVHLHIYQCRVPWWFGIYCGEGHHHRWPAVPLSSLEGWNRAECP